MATKTFFTNRVTVRAKNVTQNTPRDGGGERHLLMRSADGFIYWSYLRFSFDWTGVLKITKAELVLTTKDRDSHVGTPRAPSRVKATRLAAAFSDPNDSAAEGVFIVGSYPSSALDAARVGYGNVGHLNEAVGRINITRFLEAEAPASVKRRDGGPGLANTHHGLLLQHSPNSTYPSTRAIAASDKHVDAAARPYIELTYEAAPDEGFVVQTGPAVSIVDLDGRSFEGTYTPGVVGDTIQWVELELYKEAGATPVWTYASAASPSDKETNTFTVPMTLVGSSGSRHQVFSGQGYEWRVRLRNQKGEITAWTGKLNVTLVTEDPSLSTLRPVSGVSLATLNAVLFGATYSDPNNNAILSYQLQLRSATLPTDPSWDADLLWDSTEVAPTASELSRKVIRRAYGGPGLGAGNYSWRIRATDVRGGVSGWLYGDFTLTVGWEPNPGETEFLTGYGRRKNRARILIRAINHRVQRLTMVGATSGTWKARFDGVETPNTINYNTPNTGLQTRLEELSNIAPGDIVVTKAGNVWEVTFAGAWAGRNVPLIEWVNTELLLPAAARVQVESNRSPGVPIAIIEDAANMGVSEMYNSGGEFFFSIPATHPQIAVIEPYQVYWALEHYRGEGWKELNGGLIVDFDSTPDDAIFYGIDWLAMLDRMVDERFNPTTSPDAAAVLYPAVGSGSKYVNKTIKQIVTDQLQRAINGPNSPLRFFTLGNIDDMNETVTIFSTFKQRGPFIAGLIESHKAGTGKRTRLRVRKAVTGTYSFEVVDNPGKDRDNIRVEYGGLAQSFRVIPFGDFATRVHGIGRAFNQLKVEHFISDAPVPAGRETDYLESRYGRWPIANIWQDITDLNDLKRRVRQLSRSTAKVGKHLALALRVHALSPKDGWDVCDSLLIDIDRGIVDTAAMGSGYWTIWGWTWVLKPTGEEQLTLSIKPREDAEAADLDLIASVPINSNRPGWQIEDRDPVATDEADTFVNALTGVIYQHDTASGSWVDRTAELAASPVILRDGGLTIERFPSTVRPVRPVAVLPALPNLNYVTGDLVALLSNGSTVYRALANDTWTAAIDGGLIIPGTLPPGGLDSLSPKAPTALTMATVFSSGPGGDPEMGLQVTLTQPTLNTDDTPLTDLLATYVEVTDDILNPTDPDVDWAPAWTRPLMASIPASHTSTVLMGVRGVTRYWARARSVDTSGNLSVYSAVVESTTTADPVAPGMPQGIALVSGYKGVGVRWLGSDARDLMFNEVRYAPDLAGVPDTTDWTLLRSRANVLFIANLALALDGEGNAVAKTYWVQVRAVDHSGNVVTSAVDSTAVNFLTSPEAGWTTAQSASALPIGQADIAANSITTNLIATEGLDAAVIRSGYLKVGTTDAFADGLEVWNGGVRVVKVDEDGIYIGNVTVGLPFVADAGGVQVDDFSSIDYIHLTNAGLTIYQAGVAQTAVTPSGINASAINFGSLPGAHNVLRNSSFELAAFVTAAAVQDFTTIAQFQAQDTGVHANVGTAYTGDKVFMSSTAY